MANRGEDKSLTIPVGTNVHVCLPYTLTVKKKKKKKKKKPVQKKREERKKKQTINKQSNKTKQREKILMSRLLANQSVRTILDIL